MTNHLRPLLRLDAVIAAREFQNSRCCLLPIPIRLGRTARVAGTLPPIRLTDPLDVKDRRATFATTLGPVKREDEAMTWRIVGASDCMADNGVSVDVFVRLRAEELQS
jgi:hypothetical protein